MAARRDRLWRAVVAAVVMATGLAVLWGLVGGWIASLVELAKSEAGVSEDIGVAADGTPVISVESRAVANSVTMSRRTLDGKSWPVDYEYWLVGASLAPRNPAPGVIQLPIRWDFGRRIIGGTDGRRPPSAWYIVRDGKPVGHCYFAGFDAFSKLPVGYIGRNGYQAAVPALDEQFELPDTNDEQLNSFIETTQQLSSWGLVWDHRLDEKEKPPGWLIYLAEGNKLWEIDLRRRSTRIALEMPALVSVSSVFALKETVQSLAADGATTRERRTSFRLAAAELQEQADVVLFKAAPTTRGGEDDKEPKFTSAIALRTDDSLVMFNATTGRKKVFMLPKVVHDQRVSAYWIAPDQLIIEFDKGNWSGGPIKQLMWIDGTGKVVREAEVKIAGRVPDSPRAMAWTSLGIVPVTIAWLVAIVLGAPLIMLQSNTATNYASAIAECVRVAWPPLILLLLLAGLLAWLTLWLQRKNRRSDSGVWATFVFLLGLPGFLAYLIEHRRAKLETCPQCNEIVPRDRDACAACNTEFAPPPRVGTEIFA